VGTDKFLGPPHFVQIFPALFFCIESLHEFYHLHAFLLRHFYPSLLVFLLLYHFMLSLDSQKNNRINVQASHEASKSSRYMQYGLIDRKAKFSSKNFDKLMSERGLFKDDVASLKALNQPGCSMEVRHAKAG